MFLPLLESSSPDQLKTTLSQEHQGDHDFPILSDMEAATPEFLHFISVHAKAL
jgi:hypothetical protein